MMRLREMPIPYYLINSVVPGDLAADYNPVHNAVNIF